MEYTDLPNGTEFMEGGRRYVVSKNWSYFLSIIVPNMGDFIVAFRPDDTGLTFRSGTIPDGVIIKGGNREDKKMDFDDNDKGLCLRCHRVVHSGETRFMRHCLMNCEIEVCRQCYSDYVSMNDVFFRGAI